VKNKVGDTHRRRKKKEGEEDDKRHQVTTQRIIRSRFQESNEIGRFVNREE